MFVVGVVFPDLFIIGLVFFVRGGTYVYQKDMAKGFVLLQNVSDKEIA